MYLYLDFETRSVVDLKSRGLVNYLNHPSTSILCMGYAIDGDPVKLWTPLDDEPFPLYLPEMQQHMEGLLVAHYFTFERNILDLLFGIKTPISQWVCTMALARSNCLPGKLEEMGKFLKLEKGSQKSLKKLCRPRSRKEVTPVTWWNYEDCSDDYEKLFEYCQRDVEVSRKVHRVLGEIDPRERKIWAITERMNERGLTVDLQLIPKAYKELERESSELGKEFKMLTGGLNVTQTVALAKWAGLGSVAKDVIRDTLRDPNVDKDIKRALEIRQTLGKASIKKLPALENRTYKGKIYNTVGYAAAEKTKRWAGMGFQPQNIPRGVEGEDCEILDRLINEEPLDHPHEDIVNILRRFLMGPFYVGDYSQIEARILAWLAGEESVLDAFAAGEDVYKRQAAITYGISSDQVTKDERFMGKQQVLGLGYGCGSIGFINMLATTYDVHLSFPESQSMVNAYRESNPRVVRFWHAVDRAFRQVMLTRRAQKGPKGILIYPHRRHAIGIRLPSGGSIYYHRAMPKKKHIYFYGRVEGQSWGMIPTYGAKIVENIVQSTARDVMASAMIRLRQWPLVLTVHDEIICLEKGAPGNLKLFKALMEKPPQWAEGLPIAVECSRMKRYHK